MDVRTQGLFIFPASKMQFMQLLFCDTCWLCFTTLNPAVLFSCFFFLHFIFIFCWISWRFGTVCQSPSPRPPTRRLSDASIKKKCEQPRILSGHFTPSVTFGASVTAQSVWTHWLASMCESGTTLWAPSMKVALPHQSMAWIMYGRRRWKLCSASSAGCWAN